MKKRYAIVRADGRCPRALEKYYGLKCSPKGCDGCEIAKNYGDTKEQLIKKVAQVLFRRKYKINKRLYGYMSDNFKKRLYIQSLEVAKEIVEFLGVLE